MNYPKSQLVEGALLAFFNRYDPIYKQIETNN